jgi:hypothetical protein
MIEKLPVVYARSIYESQVLEFNGTSLKENVIPRSNSTGSLATALPGLYHASGQNKLPQVNYRFATQRSDKKEPIRPDLWKEVAFKQEIDVFYSRYQHQSWKNVVSIGDSVFERDAVRRVILNRPDKKKKCRTKTLKLKDKPDAKELIKQVRITLEVLQMMVQYDGDLDIEIDARDVEFDAAYAVMQKMK